MKVDCSAVAAGGFSTAADEEFGRAGVEEGSGEAGMPAPAHMVSLGRAGAVEFVAARRFDVVVKREAGLTCVDFLILFAGHGNGWGGWSFGLWLVNLDSFILWNFSSLFKGWRTPNELFSFNEREYRNISLTSFGVLDVVGTFPNLSLQTPRKLQTY